MAKVEERDKDELADLDERLEIARLEKYVRSLSSSLDFFPIVVFVVSYFLIRSYTLLSHHFPSFFLISLDL